MKRNCKWMKSLLAVFLFVTAIGMQFILPTRAAQNQYQSVFSIDAGRKYFSQEQLQEIIEKAYKNGYTDVQILLGNDGLRFLLDDMSLQVNGKVYESEAVKAAITKGNKEYYDDPNGNALTQSEMDAILKFAKQRNIGIIPVINSPGHMDAILTAMQTLNIQKPNFNGSKRTVDLENKEAVAFMKELIRKYANYFSKYSKIFNLGCDEYANDVDTGGWAKLQSSGLYTKFVNYVNDLAHIVKEANMLPMCFNDGIYYNSTEKFGKFDSDLIISYWTAGWWGYNVAKPNYFAERNHKILNTNDGWYWVLGNYTREEHGNGYIYDNAVKNIANKAFTDVPGDKHNVSIIGSMQCVWSDYPEEVYEKDVVFRLMDQFSEKHTQYLLRPADYTKVENALSQIPNDLSLYTQESVQRLNDAKASIVYGKRVDEQAIVDQYAQTVLVAIQNLEYKLADYSDLDALIEKSKQYDKNKYENFNLVEQAIANIKRGLDIRYQDQVNQMVKQLENALSSLKEKQPTVPAPKPNVNQPQLQAGANTYDVSKKQDWTLIALGSILVMLYSFSKKEKSTM